MYKIYLALGNMQIEDYLKNSEKDLNDLVANYKEFQDLSNIRDTIVFEGSTSYKEGVMNGLKDYEPDLLIIRENLPGSIPILDLLYQVKLNYPNLRIIFLATNRSPGDALLTELTRFTFDIIVGTNVNVRTILDRIVSPFTFADIAHLVPKAKIDEKTGEKIFEAPDVVPIVNNINISEFVESENLPKKKNKIDKKKILKNESQNINEYTEDYVHKEEMIQKEIQEEIIERKSKEENMVEDNSTLIEKEENLMVEDNNLIIEEDNDLIIEDNESINIDKSEELIIENDFDNNETLLIEDDNDEIIIINDEGINFDEKVATDNDVLLNNDDYRFNNRTFEEEVVFELPNQKPINVNIPKDLNINQNNTKNIELNIKKDSNISKEKRELGLNLEKEKVENNELKDDSVNKNTIITIRKKDKFPFKKKRNEEVLDENSLNIKSSEAPLKLSQRINPIKRFDNEDSNINNNSSENERRGLFGKILGSKRDNVKKVGQRVITFIGGGSGVGNSQIAFNTSLELAKEGYKVIYIDLNQMGSSIDYRFRLGYSDVGIDTALKGIEENNCELVNESISTIDKILYIEENNPSELYKTYSKLPKNLDYLFFSQDHIKKVLTNDENVDINTNALKDLNMYLLMQEGYDFIILDAPSKINDKLTEIATIFSMKIFFTITQDLSVIINNRECQLRLLDEKRINYRDKCYYILNKTENANFNYPKVYDWVVSETEIEGLNMVNIPYIQRDFINANYEGVPVSWLSNSKDLKKAFSEITRLILS